MIDLAKHDIGGHLVLVVDDDSRVRSYIRAILQSAGVTVLEAGDGLEALEVFHASKSRVDLVITDIRMPRMSGTDLASSLRLDAPAMPLILVSGEGAPPEMIDPGNGVLFIEKPFAPKALLEAASQFLDWSVSA
jgi:two-component system cell cycle sensor histidine kinase/response regulator CckA